MSRTVLVSIYQVSRDAKQSAFGQAHVAANLFFEHDHIIPVKLNRNLQWQF